MVHLLDDFHNIQTIKLPTSLKLSSASHMASNLLDIQNIQLKLFLSLKVKRTGTVWYGFTRMTMFSFAKVALKLKQHRKS